jgi:diaminohydroxyphosphoribosylaminopyrimidine deaminase / 5-amino-6-(5-phosphoribosylamino)uracil reductase
LTEHPADAPGRPDADMRWLREAIELSRRCPPSASAFSVGAVLVSAAGRVIATGYSRERDPKDHAEEVALARAVFALGLSGAAPLRGHTAEQAPRAEFALGGPAPCQPPAAEQAPRDRSSDPLLTGATLYSSLEPCVARASRPRSCVELITEAGIGRVVIAWLEPPLFVAGGGGGVLRAAGVDVVEIPWLAELARSVNSHLFEES